MDCQRDTEARSPLQTQLFSLQGHTALVTGAGSGLGKYMAHALLHAGANLILVAARWIASRPRRTRSF